MSETYKVVENRLTTATGMVAYASDRAYPDTLPQNPVLPATTYQVIDVERVHAMGSDPGWVIALVQVDIFDETYLGTAQGGNNVRAALSRWSGTATGVQTDDIFLVGERDAVREELGDAQRRVWRRSMDFRIHHRE